jgi:hypothetical protein
MTTETAATRVLYTRVAANIHIALGEIATIANVSQRSVVEALLAARLGIDHPMARHIFNAVNKWKGGQP